MFKQLFTTLVLILTSPAKAWNTVTREESEDPFMQRFFFPLLGILAVASILGLFLSAQEFNLSLALKHCIIEVSSMFGGLYLSAYLLRLIASRFFMLDQSMPTWLQFVGYSYSACFATNILMLFFPAIALLSLLRFYTAYIVWEGIGPFLGKLQEKEQLILTCIALGTILLTPKIITTVLKFILPGLAVA